MKRVRVLYPSREWTFRIYGGTLDLRYACKRRDILRTMYLQRTLVGRQIVLVNVRIALCQLTLLQTNIEKYTIDIVRMQQFLPSLHLFVR